MQVKEAEAAAAQQRQHLTEQLAAAQAAEAAAVTALEDATYQAVTFDKPLPGALADAVQEARRHRGAIELAIAGFERNSDAALVEVRRKQRVQQEARVKAATEGLTEAMRTLHADVEQLIAKGSGFALTAAVRALRQAIGNAGPSVPTPAGWSTNGEIFTLRSLDPEEFLQKLVVQIVRGEPADALRTVDQMAAGVLSGCRAQPDTWEA